MSKPEDIPEDVWRIASDEALKYVEWIDPPPVEGAAAAEHVLAFSFSRLILAERERCARIVEDLLVFADTTSEADKRIAAAIRKGGE